MLKYELLREEGVLIVTPEGPLKSADFEQMAAVVDQYIEEKGKLQGLMIYAQSFPGWADFAALLSHLRFVRGHHRRIERAKTGVRSQFLLIFPRPDSPHAIDAPHGGGCWPASPALTCPASPST
jgi:hypothetical protein